MQQASHRLKDLLRCEIILVARDQSTDVLPKKVAADEQSKCNKAIGTYRVIAGAKNFSRGFHHKNKGVLKFEFTKR